MRNMQTSRSFSRTKDANGRYCNVSAVYLIGDRLTLGRWSPNSSGSSPRSFANLDSLLRLSSAAGVRLSNGGGIVPSPTSARSVSGKKLGISNSG